MKNNFSKGMSVVEVVVGSAILLIGFLALMGTYRMYIQATFSGVTKIQASYLLQEGEEVARIFRDTNYNNIKNLSTTTAYYLTWSGSAWATSTTPSTIYGIFTRKISISDLYRDANSNIVASGGTYDPQIKKVTVAVSWNDGNSVSVKSISTYLSNIFND